MIKKIALNILFLSFIVTINAQTKGAPVTIGNSYVINSKVLNQEREIQVHLPSNYKDSIVKQYPVLYVVDGQDYFSPAVSFQKMIAKRGIVPQMIIVGIKTDIVKRRILFDENKGATNFINFLENELIPFVDSNYRTSKEKERLFFGWEMAGGIGIETIARKSNLFSGYIIPSATNIRGTRVDSVEKYLKNLKKEETPFLLMTAAPDESWLNDNQKLQGFFNKETYHHLNWRFSILKREKHHTTPFKTLNEGILDYFYNYTPVTYRTLKEYEDFGGVEGLKSFYKKRGERFGISKEIDEVSKMFILYNAVVENNYERFIYYEKAFEGHIEKSLNPSWFHRYGGFYLKHNNLKEALYVYNYGLQKLGDSKLLFRGLGDVFAAKGEKRKAKKAYKKALKIDPKYKQALEGLNRLQ